MGILSAFIRCQAFLRINVGAMLNVLVRLCLPVALFAPLALNAQSKEYQIKAAFVYNFAQFVLWPPGAFTNSAQPFQIGVLGENPFGKSLEETVQGETIKGHPITIVQSTHVEKLAGSQIIFVSKSATAHLDDLFQKLDSKPVLTISEDPNFIQHGGIINLTRDGGKIHFEINPDAAEKNGLKLGSELLSVGKVVHSNSATK
jgi:hypothetical protein